MLGEKVLDLKIYTIKQGLSKIDSSTKIIIDTKRKHIYPATPRNIINVFKYHEGVPTKIAVIMFLCLGIIYEGTIIIHHIYSATGEMPVFYEFISVLLLCGSFPFGVLLYECVHNMYTYIYIYI